MCVSIGTVISLGSWQLAKQRQLQVKVATRFHIVLPLQHESLAVLQYSWAATGPKYISMLAADHSKLHMTAQSALPTAI